MKTDRDLWRQSSREEKRRIQKDLEKHFKLRFEANDAIVKWFQKKHKRDPSMEEVAGIRDQAMTELEPKVREELLGRGREVARNRRNQETLRPLRNTTRLTRGRTSSTTSLRFPYIAGSEISMTSPRKQNSLTRSGGISCNGWKPCSEGRRVGID